MRRAGDVQNQSVSPVQPDPGAIARGPAAQGDQECPIALGIAGPGDQIGTEGTGIGKEVFQYAIQRTKDKGAHLVQLTTDQKRPDALRFYQQLGFVNSHNGMKLHL